MVNKETIKRIKGLITETAGIDFLPEPNGIEFSKDLRIREDLGLDSLDLVELTMAIEEEWSISILDTELELVDTVGNLVDLLDKKLI